MIKPHHHPVLSDLDGGNAPSGSGNPSISPGSIVTDSEPQSRAFVPQLDSFRTEYHPHSDRKVKIKEELFEEYCEYDRQPDAENKPNEKPWLPFESKSDFEFAEVAQDAHLNNVHIDRILDIFQRCLAGKDKLNIRSSKQLKEMWNQASKLLPAVSDRSN